MLLLEIYYDLYDTGIIIWSIILPVLSRVREILGGLNAPFDLAPFVPPFLTFIVLIATFVTTYSHSWYLVLLTLALVSTRVALTPPHLNKIEIENNIVTERCYVGNPRPWRRKQTIGSYSITSEARLLTCQKQKGFGRVQRSVRLSIYH